MANHGWHGRHGLQSIRAFGEISVFAGDEGRPVVGWKSLLAGSYTTPVLPVPVTIEMDRALGRRSAALSRCVGKKT